MDILNFISWIKGGRQVTTVDASKTLIPLGLKDNRRDDGYLAGAITVQDLAAQIAPPAPVLPYKVYTALLTQSGGSEINTINSGQLVKGVTYFFGVSVAVEWDFSNVGGPVFPESFSFVATDNAEPNNWGTANLQYNLGAPVVTVLENTIGNIWFTYHGVGYYDINKDSNFEQNKTFVILTNNLSGNVGIIGQNMALGFECYGDNVIQLTTAVDNAYENGVLFNTPIEIRVYN